MNDKLKPEPRIFSPRNLCRSLLQCQDPSSQPGIFGHGHRYILVSPDGVTGDNQSAPSGYAGPLPGMERSIKAPGSPSSALQMIYFFSPGALRQNCHFRAVKRPGAAAAARSAALSGSPPAGTSPEEPSAGACNAPPAAIRITSIFSGLIRPQLRRMTHYHRFGKNLPRRNENGLYLLQS